jgi:hypothetical protein
MVSPEKSTGGLYRMWRQIEMVVVQSRFKAPLHSSSPSSSSNVLSSSTSNGNMKEKKSIGGLFSKDKDKDSNLLDTGNNGRQGTASNSTGTNKAPGGLTADLIPLGLTNSHTPSVVTSFISASTTTTSTNASTASGAATPLPIVGVDGSGTPVGTTMSLRSYSTSSLSPTSDGEPSSHTSHSQGNNNNATTSTTSRDAKAQAKEKEKERERREKEKEKERKEKEKKEKEKEKAKKKKMPIPPALFAEVVLDGEVCGRTTVKRPNLFSSSVLPTSSSSSSARPSTAPSPSTGTGLGSSSTAGGGSAMPNAGPEWFENFLFGDLPSFGNMFVSVWKAPEKTKEDKDKSSSSTSPGNNAGSTTTIGSNLNGSVVSGLTHSITATTTTTTTGSATSGRSATGGRGAGVGLFGGAKGTQFLGCVEISIPNFRRGEWVEGWWPVYAHANAGAGSGNKDGGLSFRLNCMRHLFVSEQVLIKLGSLVSVWEWALWGWEV